MPLFDFSKILKDTCNAGVFFGRCYFFIKKSGIYFSLEACRNWLY